jgi:hypothetical protein
VTYLANDYFQCTRPDRSFKQTASYFESTKTLRENLVHFSQLDAMITLQLCFKLLVVRLLF